MLPNRPSGTRSSDSQTRTSRIQLAPSTRFSPETNSTDASEFCETCPHLSPAACRVFVPGQPRPAPYMTLGRLPFTSGECQTPSQVLAMCNASKKYRVPALGRAGTYNCVPRQISLPPLPWPHHLPFQRYYGTEKMGASCQDSHALDGQANFRVW